MLLDTLLTADRDWDKERKTDRDRYLVSDVLLLSRSMTFRVNKGGVGDQVSAILHDEAPARSKQVHAHIHTQTLWIPLLSKHSESCSVHAALPQTPAKY